MQKEIKKQKVEAIAIKYQKDRGEISLSSTKNNER